MGAGLLRGPGRKIVPRSPRRLHMATNEEGKEASEQLFRSYTEARSENFFRRRWITMVIGISGGKSFRFWPLYMSGTVAHLLLFLPRSSAMCNLLGCVGRFYVRDRFRSRPAPIDLCPGFSRLGYRIRNRRFTAGEGRPCHWASLRAARMLAAISRTRLRPSSMGRPRSIIFAVCSPQVYHVWRLRCLQNGCWYT